jgi:hypothetical protein
VRYFLRRRVAPGTRILLIESGSRHITDKVIPRVRAQFGSELQIDLVTCYPDAPDGLGPANIFNVSGYRKQRLRLVRALRANHYPVAAILCSDEATLSRWKWALAAALPSKILVVNENADYFWLDYANWGAIYHLVRYRAGFADAGIVRMLARVIAFPFTFSYLVLYATAAHFRRALNRGFR